MSNNSLQAVQEKLEERGVWDVKFLFKRESLGLPMTDVELDLADVMSKYMAGNKTVVTELPSEELTLTK